MGGQWRRRAAMGAKRSAAMCLTGAAVIFALALSAGCGGKQEVPAASRSAQDPALQQSSNTMPPEAAEARRRALEDAKRRNAEMRAMSDSQRASVSPGPAQETSSVSGSNAMPPEAAEARRRAIEEASRRNAELRALPDSQRARR